MNKVVKTSMIGLGIVTALFIVATVVFIATFNINDYKERITTAVKDETGRTLTFDGDLKLDFFPFVGVELGGLSLSNAEGFGQKPMVQTLAARVSVRFFPLLKGQIQFGHLDLDGVTLNLSRDAGGKSNWADLVGRDTTTESTVDDASSFSLDIDGVNITNANLLWDDRVSDTKFVLSGINFETGRIFKGAPFPVKADLEFECAKPNAKGKMSFSGKSSIDLDNREYGHMDMKLSIEAEGKDIPGGKGAADMSVQFAVFDFNKEHAQITGLTVTSYGATMHMDGTFEGISHGLKKMAATITVDPFDARKTLVALGDGVPDTADAGALTKVGGMVELACSPGQIDAKTLQVDVDDARIVGRVRLKKDVGESLYFARLDVGKLDLDRYLAPDHRETVTANKSKGTSASKNERLLNSALLRELSLDIEAKIAELRFEGALLSKVNAVIKSRHGLLRVSPLSADLYGGSLSAGVTINAMSKYPKTDIIAGLDKVDVGQLSRDVLGSEEYEGILHLNGAVSCEGERVPPMLRTMNGKISFNLSDGVFPGVDLMHMVKTTHASKGKKEGDVKAAKSDSTKFGSISGTGVITAGVLKNRDLEVKAPGLRAAGHGAIVLPTRQIDYMLKVKLVPTSQGQGGKSSDDMFGVMVPIRVSGTLSNPHYWVSLTEYVKALGGAVIGTAGSIIGGVTSAIKGVGSAMNEKCCEDDKSEKKAEPKKKSGFFFGLF